jgi:hypothetical protein
MAATGDALQARCDANLMVAAGAIAILGSLALVIGNVVGSMVVPGHDWVADTVSNLAVGRYEIIQDVALYGYAGALLACAIGASHFHPGGHRWNAGIAALCLLALCVVVIGARNEYGDDDNDGIVVHIYVVYALGVLFAATFLLMANGMGLAARRYRALSLICAALWIIGAPLFFLVPTAYDGAWERGLGLIAAAWVVGFALMLTSAGREAAREI